MENKKHSSSSFLPYWDGATYTKYAAKFYDIMTNLTGWRRKLSRYALEGLAPCKMLDVGCGTGFLLNIAKKNGFQVTGIDPSVGMLEKAKQKYGFSNREVIVSSADNLPFEDQSFDLIIASGSLVHIPNLEDVSSEIKRVLKINGKLRIIDHATPIQKNIFTPIALLFSQASGDILHDYEYYFKDLKLLNRKTIGRGGYMQVFDFEKNNS